MKVVHKYICSAFDFHVEEISKLVECPIFSYTGAIHPQFLAQFQDEMEALAEHAGRASSYRYAKRVAFVISTPGGVVEAVEKMVDVTRAHFEEIYFFVPQAAMSAGTILCMAGDKIFMDYASSLGPHRPSSSKSRRHPGSSFRISR